MMSYGMEQPFGQLRTAVLIVSTQPPAHSLLLVGGRVKNRKPRHCASPVQHQFQHQCMNTSILVTNQNHSSTVIATKKVNSIPTRPSPVSKGIRDWNLFLVFLPAYQGIICYGVWSCCLLSKCKLTLGHSKFRSRYLLYLQKPRYNIQTIPN